MLVVPNILYIGEFQYSLESSLLVVLHSVSDAEANSECRN